MGSSEQLRLAAAALADPETGLADSDRGVLDISAQQSNGDIRAYFAPEEAAPTPTPEPEPTPEPAENAGDAGDAAAAE